MRYIAFFILLTLCIPTQAQEDDTKNEKNILNTNSVTQDTLPKIERKEVVKIEEEEEDKPDVPKSMYNYDQKDVEALTWDYENSIHTATDYPEEWNKYSAIYLTLTKTFQSLKVEEGARVCYLSHTRIKLLDEAAVSNFSEIYYSSGNYGNIKDEFAKRKEEYLGVKVVKPDGTETEIKNSEIIEEDGQKKLAIPNLEVGDILDYYIFTYDDIPVYADGWYSVIDRFPIVRNYPTKNFKYNIITDKHWNTKFTTGKNGCEIKEKEENFGFDNLIEYTVEESDIEALDSDRWLYHFQSLPYVKVYCLFKYSYHSWDMGAEDQFRTSSLEEDDIEEYYKELLSTDDVSTSTYKSFKKFLGKDKLKSLSKVKLLEEYYKFVRNDLAGAPYIKHRFEGNPGYTPGPYIMQQLAMGMNELEIPYQVVVVSPRQGGHHEDVISIEETDYMLKVNLEDEPIFFYRPDVFTPYNKIPYQFEGLKTYIISGNKKHAVIFKYKTPISHYKDNAIYHTTVVSFDKEDQSILNTKNKVIYSGHQIENHPYRLGDWLNFLWKESEHYDKTAWGKNPKDYSKKTNVQLQKFKEEDEKRLKESFESYAKNMFDTEVDKVENYKGILNEKMGKKTNFEIDFDCNLTEIVKKVGPNYIVKVGQFVGGQVDISKEDTRQYPITSEYPRMYSYDVTLHIPEGYTVDGLEELNNTIDNEAGSFKSTGKVEGNTLKIKFEKIYKNNYEPAENWQKMRDFLIPANLLVSKEIMLRKQ